MSIEDIKKELFSKSNLFSFGIVVILFALLHGEIILWESANINISLKTIYLLPLGIALSGFVLLQNYRFALFSLISPSVFILGLLLVYFSNWLNSTYNFFQGPGIKGELFVCFLISLFLLHKRCSKFFYYYFILTILILSFSFFKVSNGELIFSDDHTAVFYRLNLLKENFPNIPFYQPLWNAGIDARDFFSTGILNLFLIAYPIIKFFPLENSYNYIVAGVIFFALPISILICAQIIGLEKRISALAMTLVLCTSIIWYRWALSYGPMGFITSCCLIPINFAYVIKILSDRELGFLETLFFITCFSLMLLWSPTLLVFIPLGIYALFNFKKLLRKKYTKTIISSLIVVNLPWVIIWLNVANVFSFISHKTASISTEQMNDNDSNEKISAHNSILQHEDTVDRRKYKGKSRTLSIKLIKKTLRNFATNSNPLLLFLTIPGIALIYNRDHKRIFSIITIWLLFLGIVVSPIKPQLELERMLIILLILSSIPVAICLDTFLKDSQEVSTNFYSKMLLAIPFAFFLTGLQASSYIIHNRSMTTYAFKNNVVDDLANAIKNNNKDSAGNEGRTIYTGFVLHELEQGHLAPLTYFTKAPMIASSHLHNNWSYTDVIPEYYLDNNLAEQYFDLMNATLVIAHEKNWKMRFKNDNNYSLIGEFGKFKVFKRINYKSNYFYQGEGKVLEQNTNSVKLEVKTTENVIKFKYYPFLQSSECQIEPFPVAGNVTLCKLRNCPVNKEITINSVSAFKRIFK